jgi:hypothetical protein
MKMIRPIIKETVKEACKMKKSVQLHRWLVGINKSDWTQEEKDYAINLIKKAYNIY